MMAYLPTTGKSGVLTLTGAVDVLLARNNFHSEGIVQNKGANPISLVESDDGTAPTLTDAGIRYAQYEKHFIESQAEIRVIGTAGDKVAWQWA